MERAVNRCRGGGGGGSFPPSSSPERCAPCVRDPARPWLAGVQGEAGSAPEGGAREPPAWKTQEVVLYFRSRRGLCTKPRGRRWLCRPGSLALGQPHRAWRPALRPGAAAAGEGTRQTPPTPPPLPPRPVTLRCPCCPCSGSGLPIWRDAVAFSLTFRGWQGVGRGEASTPRMRGCAALTPGASSLSAFVLAAVGLGAEQGHGSREGQAADPQPRTPWASGGRAGLARPHPGGSLLGPGSLTRRSCFRRMNPQGMGSCPWRSAHSLPPSTLCLLSTCPSTSSRFGALFSGLVVPHETRP